MTGQVRRSMHSRPGAATRRAGPTVRPPAGPSGSAALSYKGSLQGSLPRHTPSWVQLPDVLPHSRAIRSYFFQKTPLRPALGQKEKGPKALFLRLSKKRLCHFFEKAAACRARDWSAASGQTPHLQPEKCFPDAHAAGENRSQLDSRLRARTLRGFFLYRYFCFCLDLKHSKASRMLCSGAGVSRLTITIATQAHRKAGSSS